MLREHAYTAWRARHTVLFRFDLARNTDTHGLILSLFVNRSRGLSLSLQREPENLEKNE